MTTPWVAKGTTLTEPGAATNLTEGAKRAIECLVALQNDDGVFVDRPVFDGGRIAGGAFNGVRHAHTTLVLWRAMEELGQDHTGAAEAATRFIRRSCEKVRIGGSGFAYHGLVRLGGQAIAIAALLERRRVTGDTTDDALIERLAECIARMERRDQPGAFCQSVEVGGTLHPDKPDAISYQGQALLALVRLSKMNEYASLRPLAERATTYHALIRDGDVATLSRTPREDLWLTIALTEFEDPPNRAAIEAMIRLQAASMFSGVRKLTVQGETGRLKMGLDSQQASLLARRIEGLSAVETWCDEEDDSGFGDRYRESIGDAAPMLLRWMMGSASGDPHLSQSGGTERSLETISHTLSALLIVRQEATAFSSPSMGAAIGGEAVRRGRHRVSTQSVLDAATRRGIPILATSMPAQRIELGTGAYRQRFWGLSPSTDSQHGTRIAKDKLNTKGRLAAAGLPVPVGHAAHTLEQALDRARAIGYPVVLKPRSGNRGHDVYVDLENDADLIRSWDLLIRSEPKGGPLIERFLDGGEYRVLVVGGKVIAANHRIPPTVTGDGRSTIRELVDAENQRPERRSVGQSGLCQIVLDGHADMVLAKAGRTVESVLPEGEQQLVRRTTNVSSGATTAEVTALMHPVNAMICTTAARVCGLGIAGVDFVATDITRSVVETGGGIIEVNSSPGFIDHLMPSAGESRDVGGAIVDMLYPPGAPVRAPLVLVVALDPRVAACIASRIEATGQTTGLLDLAGMSIGGAKLLQTDPELALNLGPLMSNPMVEAAVVDLDPVRSSVDVDSVLYVDVVVASEAGLAGGVPAMLREHGRLPERGWVVVGESPSSKLEGKVINLPASASEEEIAQVAAELLLT